MDASQIFSLHLQTSLDGFVWAVQQTPSDRLNLRPINGLGDWSVMRQVFHMLYYERYAVLPGMKQWLGEPLPDMSNYDDNRDWETNEVSLDELLRQFKAVREEQIALLPRFTPDLWHETRDTDWDQVTLYWLVSKTWQHTNEHTSNIMRIALFWDRFAAREAAPQNSA